MDFWTGKISQEILEAGVEMGVPFLFGPRAWVAALGQTYIVLVHGWWGCSSSLLKTVFWRKPLARRWGTQAHRCHSHSPWGSRHILNITRTHNLERHGSSLEEDSLLKGARERSADV